MAVALMLTCTACPPQEDHRSSNSSEKSEKSEKSKKHKKNKSDANNASDATDDLDNEEAYIVSPTGDPVKDAKACEEYLENCAKAHYSMGEIEAKITEYYADNEDNDGYEDFFDNVFSFIKELDKYEKETEKLEARIKKAKAKMYNDGPVANPAAVVPEMNVEDISTDLEPVDL